MENLILHTEYLSIYQVVGVCVRVRLGVCVPLCPSPTSGVGRAGKGKKEHSVGYTYDGTTDMVLYLHLLACQPNGRWNR